MSTELQQINTGTGALVLSHDSMKAMHDMAKMMASATVTVPKHLAGSPGDCLAVVMQAMQWGMNPFAVAQKTHLVNGTLGYEAQLVNAVVVASKAAGRFHYEYKGDGAALACRVGAVINGDVDIITWGEWLSVSDVTTKNSPLWKTNPRQQLGYLQVKNWARAFTPGAILGVYTDDELIDQPLQRIQEAQPEPQEYSQDEFDQKVDQWKGIIESGRHSANSLIAQIESKGKFFTMDQKMTLASFEVPEAQVEEVE